MLFPSVVSKLFSPWKTKELEFRKNRTVCHCEKEQRKKGKESESRKKIASHSMIIILFPSSSLLHILSNSFLLFFLLHLPLLSLKTKGRKDREMNHQFVRELFEHKNFHPFVFLFFLNTFQHEKL